MPSLDEITSGASGILNASLRAGIELVSGKQQVLFTKYSKRILALDGSAFWVKSSLLGDIAPSMLIQGSLHPSADNRQEERQSYSRINVIFTYETDAGQGFNSLGPNDAYIGSLPGIDGTLPIRFMFSRLGYYQNAGVYHYSGVAILPTSLPQIIDRLADLDLISAVVSNSLPAWLALNNYAPFYGFGNTIPLYPSFLVTPNMQPPFGSIHIPPEATEALASTPSLDSVSSHFHLARDKVRVSLYGVRNAEALTFLDCVVQYSRDYNVIGLTNCPIVRDNKEPQVELGTLAMSKTIDFEVTYLQTAIRAIDRQLFIDLPVAVIALPLKDTPTFGPDFYYFGAA
jgi:hypothetical protein